MLGPASFVSRRRSKLIGRANLASRLLLVSGTPKLIDFESNETKPIQKYELLNQPLFLIKKKKKEENRPKK